MDKGEPETLEAEEIKDGEIKIPEETPAEAPTVAKRATVASVKKGLDELKQDVEGDVLQWLGQLDVRLEDVEKRTAAHNEALLGDVKTRLDAVEGATGTLADVIRSHLNEAEEQPPAAAAAAGFTMAPMQPEEETTRTEDIRSMADVCQTMTDVLMICRYLKADPTLTDAERNEIIKLATGAANVPITQGLQIRAGVRNVAV